jgi:hypothetical protein
MCHIRCWLTIFVQEALYTCQTANALKPTSFSFLRTTLCKFHLVRTAHTKSNAKNFFHGSDRSQAHHSPPSITCRRGPTAAGMPRHPPPGSRRPTRDFFASWLATLRSPLLPLLRRALSSSSGSWDDLFSSVATAVEAHFQAHWSALDAAARQYPAQVIAAGGWRSPLELPFLWLGDVHPPLLTSLLRTLSPSPLLLAAARSAPASLPSPTASAGPRRPSCPPKWPAGLT